MIFESPCLNREGDWLPESMATFDDPLSGSRWRPCRPRVAYRKYLDAIEVLIVPIIDDHPAPMSEDEAKARPASAERGSEQRELPKRLERGAKSLVGRRRQGVCLDERAEVALGGHAHDYRGQGSKILEWPVPTCFDIFEPRHRVFPGARNSI
jgi:hypothetical protein